MSNEETDDGPVGWGINLESGDIIEDQMIRDVGPQPAVALRESAGDLAPPETFQERGQSFGAMRMSFSDDLIEINPISLDGNLSPTEVCEPAPMPPVRMAATMLGVSPQVMDLSQLESGNADTASPVT